MNKQLSELTEQIISGTCITEEQALQLACLPSELLPDLFAAANKVRQHFFGNQVTLCGIINAKSGLCPEDCSFCAQSAHHTTGVDSYPLVDQTVLLEGARATAASHAACYGIVTSGSGISSQAELKQLCQAIQDINEDGRITAGASLGMLSSETFLQLKAAGLTTYHHNLETARSFFPQICSTHDYEQDLETVRLARQHGLRVCSGGLFGLGESMAQRVELAMTLRELDVDSIPINFLDPVEGTPLAEMNQLTPMICLHIIALYRMILADRHITVCGGRQRNLRDLQSWLFMAGASGIMTGNYLTKTGRRPEDDLQMLQDLGLELSEEIIR